MKKVFIFTVLALSIAFLPVLSHAQSYNIISFDIGYKPGFSTDGNDDALTANTFGINVKLADSISAGVTFLNTRVRYDQNTNTNDTFLTFKYHILNPLRAVILVGNRSVNTAVLPAPANNTPQLSAGLGFEYVPLQKKFQDTLAAELKISVEYLGQAEAFSNGELWFGIVLGLGV